MFSPQRSIKTFIHRALTEGGGVQNLRKASVYSPNVLFGGTDLTAAIPSITYSALIGGLLLEVSASSIK